MVETKDRTKKVCRKCHTEVYQKDEARICKQRATGNNVKSTEVVTFCPNCNKQLNEKTEVTTKKRHKGMPRGEWIFDDYFCSGCDESMNITDYESSRDKFGTALCLSCIESKDSV